MEADIAIGIGQKFQPVKPDDLQLEYLCDQSTWIVVSCEYSKWMLDSESWIEIAALHLEEDDPFVLVKFLNLGGVGGIEVAQISPKVLWQYFAPI